MTEQERFHFGYVCGDTGLIDEQAELKWFIENCCSINDLKKNWKTVCNKLNELNDENEQLKKENEYLHQKIEDLNYENIEIIHDKMFLEEKLEDIEKENGEND